MRLEKRLSHETNLPTNARKDYDVVIIGNGPSAIILSYFLSGHWPYYNGNPVEDPVLQYRLKYVSQSKSLVLEDLEWLSEGMYDSRTMNPVSILFDRLYHPNADMLSDNPAAIEWRYNPENEVRHVVLGLGPPGGSWHRMTNSQLTVSLARWLELPEFSFQDWCKKNEDKLCNLPKISRVCGVHPGRTNAAYIGLYYSDYVSTMGLSSNFLNNVKVTSVTQSTDTSSQWQIDGILYGEGHDMQYYSIMSDNVVLACGAFNVPRKLGVSGEHYPFVYHRLPDTDLLTHKCPVLVVGCGLVALDTILNLMSQKIPVIHVFRRSVKDPELILNQLSSAYADYLKLKPLMCNKGHMINEYYTPFSQHVLREILENKEVIIESVNKKNRFRIHVCKVIINIGLLPDLSMVTDADTLKEEPENEFNIKLNPLDIDLYTYETRSRKGLYAIGPLVGDNFVRFITGGALAITHGLFRNDRLSVDIE